MGFYSYYLEDVKVVSGGNVAEVSSGVYMVNAKEIMRKSTTGYKNQRRIYDIMIRLINKYGQFQYENQTYLYKDSHWQCSRIQNKTSGQRNLSSNSKWG